MSLNLNYIAGFFDGEGSVRIHFKKAKPKKGAAFGYFIVPHIEISQKYPSILEEILKILKMGRVAKLVGGFVWIISARNDCIRFIQLMGDKVILKKKHLELLKEFLELKGVREFYTKSTFLKSLDLAEQITLINSKHSPATIKRIAIIRFIVSKSNYTLENRGKRISEKLKGRKFSDASKSKMSMSAKKTAFKHKRDRYGRFFRVIR